MKAPIRYAVFLLLASLHLKAGMLEDAAKALSDDDFLRREQAESELKEAGFEALAWVDPLLLADDPEVAFRAQRIHDWIICGIDERVPAATASDLPRFDTLNADRQAAIIRNLAGLEPPHLSALVSLHSRLITMQLPGARRENLLTMAEAGIKNSANPKNLARFGQSPLHIKTRAMLINHTASSGQAHDGLGEIYASWLKHEPALRMHLDRKGVSLEVERLRMEWDKQGALSYIAEIKDEDAFKILVKEFRDWILGDPRIKFDELEETKAIAYIELTFESISPGDAFSLCRKLRERIPALDDVLRESRKIPLQALRSWEAGKHAQAVELLYSKGSEARHRIDFLTQMILDTKEVDFTAVIAPMNRQSAATIMELLLRKRNSEFAIEHAVNLSACLRAQDGSPYKSAFAGEAGEIIAMELWKSNRDDLCYQVMQESFWGWELDGETHLSFFPALACAMGRIDDALETAENAPPEHRYLDYKKSYLYRAAGKTAEALVCSSRIPHSDIHKLLLLESRDWAHLVEQEKSDKQLSDWFAFLNGDREAWRGNVPEPEKKSTLLRLMLDDHASLLAQALENVGPRIAEKRYAKALAGHHLLGKLLGKEIIPAADERESTSSTFHNKKTYEISRPQVGDLGDPRADAFAVLDGLERARELFAKGDRDAAKSLVMAIVIRITLDRKLREQTTSFSMKSDGSVHSGSVLPAEILMRGCLVEGTARDIALPAAKIISLIYLNRFQAGVHDATARVLASHGDYENACREYHRACAQELEKVFRSKHIGDAAYLVELEIRRSMASDQYRDALGIYRRHHRLIPYNIKLRNDLLDGLRAAGDFGNAHKLNLTVTDFWKEKLKDIPDAKPYRIALSEWRRTFGKP